MQNENQKQNSSQNRPPISWPNTEIQKLIMAMTVYFSDLKEYGQDINLKLMLNKFRVYFEAEFSVDHVIWAIHEHCKRSREIPRISDLMAILKPEPPKVSEAQYIQAVKEYERNGFNQYTDAYTTKKAYEDQQTDKREQHKITNEQILAIAGNAMKRIGNS